MGTAKKGIQQLAQICVDQGVNHVVVSPGSRNAPLTLAFCALEVDVLNIPDERCAAFFALGIAQATHNPVVLVCTSGTAMLNYAPAIAEAYYQGVSLVVLSGDRPQELIDMGDGQSIRQVGAFRNFIKASFNFPQEATTTQELFQGRSMAYQALNICQNAPCGPVHINVPMAEPLYVQAAPEPLPIEEKKLQTKENPQVPWNDLQRIWHKAERIMLLLGTFPPNPKFNNALSVLADSPKVAVLTETNSNAHGDYCHHIDLALCAMDKEESYYPDLLVTLGENVISKKVKAWLRNNTPRYHWHVDIQGKAYDTFQCLTHKVQSSTLKFLDKANGFNHVVRDSTYRADWLQLTHKARERTEQFIASCGHSDLAVLHFLHEQTPVGYHVHYANSTSVRYAQLFRHREDLFYFANRGTSGIDGCTSTAAGHAYASQSPTLLVTGDVAFFYDSNALWNKYLPEQLRIVLINNEGGNIFRIIEGPDSTEQAEEHFEARHHTSAANLAKTYQVPYYFCASIAEMKDLLPKFFGAQEGRPAILEVKTPNVESAATMRELFKALERS